MQTGKQADLEMQLRRTLLAYVELVISCVALVGVFVFHNGGRLNVILAGYIGVGYVCLLAFAGTQIRKCKEEKHVGSALFPNLITALNILGIALIALTGREDFFWGVTLWGWFISILFAIKRNRESNDFPLGELRKEHKILLGAVVAVTVFVCVAPMGSSPFWRLGEGHLFCRPHCLHADKSSPFWKVGGGYPVPAYAVLADSILAGKLSLNLPVDPKLREMNNPRDPAARVEMNVRYFHDFAFYGGKYYVYFGAVPALLLFIPYQLLTGMPLATYHATQIFTAFAIGGLFALFFLLCGTFFRKLPFSLYLASSAVFSMVSVSFAIVHGNQYSTAVVSGICFEVWSMYFFVRAGWHEADAGSRMRHLFFGSLCGALVFGCRPPIGLANIILIPVLVRVWHMLPDIPRKQRTARILFALIPYLVVAIVLMLYNQARFGSPLDFGVKYNLTHLDSAAYSFDFLRSVNMIIDYLFQFSGLKSQFPFVKFFSGAFFNYPILLLVFFLLSRNVYGFLRESKIYLLSTSVAVGAFAVVVLDVYAAPWWVHERNRMDFYFLLGIASFFALCAYYETSSKTLQEAIIKGFSYAALLTVLTMVLLLLIPYEQSFTLYYPDFNNRLVRILLFQSGVPPLPQ